MKTITITIPSDGEPISVKYEGDPIPEVILIASGLLQHEALSKKPSLRGMALIQNALTGFFSPGIPRHKKHKS